MSSAIPQNRASFELSSLASLLGGKTACLPLASSPHRALGVATDTREDLVGKIFVALAGDRFDAHDYLQQAVDQGAVALVVQSCPASKRFVAQQNSNQLEQAGVWVVVVPDTLVALGALACEHRRRWGGRVLAIAGSAGKTTTRALCSELAELLVPAQVHSTRGNLNNRIGVPMTLLGLCEGHHYAIVELGTNCPGEVARLGQMAAPDVALLTLIDLEHTEGLGDLDGVEAEERAVFEALPAQGVAIGYGEDRRVLRSLSAAPCETKLSYGWQPDRDLVIGAVHFDGPLCARLTLHLPKNRCLRFATRLLGQPGALAHAAATLAVEQLTLKPLNEELCERAGLAIELPGRGNVLFLSGPRYVLDDTYNSNPASAAASIRTGEHIAREVGGRLWLVMGEMLELGSHSRGAHEELGQVAAKSDAQAVFFLQGDAEIAATISKKQGKEAAFYSRWQDLLRALVARLAPLDVVVVKASRGVRAEQVVQGLSAAFPMASPADLPPVLSSDSSALKP